jgi:hypothetical protein
MPQDLSLGSITDDMWYFMVMGHFFGGGDYDVKWWIDTRNNALYSITPEIVGGQKLAATNEQVEEFVKRNSEHMLEIPHGARRRVPEWDQEEVFDEWLKANGIEWDYPGLE